jgi:hypothetical protein
MATVFRNIPSVEICRRFARDSRGAVALIFAIVLPVLLGAAGLGIEVGSWLVYRRAVQGVADAAAVSAATAIAYKGNPVTEAETIAALNGYKSGVDGTTVTINYPPKSGSHAGNDSAVEVIITEPGSNWFSALLPVAYTAPQIFGRSVAIANPAVDCILSLSKANSDTTGIPGVQFDLTKRSVSMPKCSIGDNASGSKALQLIGLSTNVKAYTATVVGQITAAAGESFTWVKTPFQQRGNVPGPATPNPYACLPATQCRTISPPRAPAPIPPLTTATLPAANCPGPTRDRLLTCFQGLVVTSGQTLQTIRGRTYTFLPSGNGPAISVAGTLNITGGGNLTIVGISVTGNGSLNISGNGNLTILGGPNQPAISVSGGNLSLKSGTNAIQGGSGQPAILVTGGTVSLSAGSNAILGGSGGAAVAVSGGNVSFATAFGTNTFQGGSGSPAIKLSGTSPTLTINAATNHVLAGAGSPAIIVDPTSGNSTTVGGELIFGNGNNKIQGAAADGGQFSAMTIGGFGQVEFGNGNTVFGGPSVTANVPAVSDNAQFQAGQGLGLVLGSGIFQFMEGLSVTGGDLTLNPARTSGGIGYYIMDGGSVGGLNMTAGDLNGKNATIILTGGSAGGVASSDFANINVNGADGIALTAPTTAGAWNTAGIAVFQDVNAPAGNANTIYGVNFDNITGAIYLPNNPLVFEGLSAMTSQCTQLIAGTLEILGLTSIDDECQGTGTVPITGGSSIVLVE